MEYDEFRPGGPKFMKADGVFTVGTDAVMLADFVKGIKAKNALDMGSGSGVISVLLALGCERVFVEGIDIQERAVEISNENAAVNGVSDRVSFSRLDIKKFKTTGKAGTFDLVVTNPPYFPVGSGKSSAEECALIAREEVKCTLEDVCAAAGYFTKWGGVFAMVHRPERLSEIFCNMTKYGLEPKRIRFVHPRPNTVPSLVLVEAKRGGKPGLTIEMPLIICDEYGNETDEVKKIYRRED